MSIHFKRQVELETISPMSAEGTGMFLSSENVTWNSLIDATTVWLENKEV